MPVRETTVKEGPRSHLTEGHLDMRSFHRCCLFCECSVSDKKLILCTLQFFITMEHFSRMEKIMSSGYLQLHLSNANIFAIFP